MSTLALERFEGWAVVELYGHQKEIGYVTTRYFGEKPMFQIDVPEIAPRQRTLDFPTWVQGTWAPAGSVVETDGPVAAKVRLVGLSSIYALNPCTEEEARRQLQTSAHFVRLISVPAGSEDEPEPAFEQRAAGMRDRFVEGIAADFDASGEPDGL